MNTEKYSLVLRACNADMSSKNSFIWPTSGLVECPDWKPTNDCGNGLHGWLHGHGEGSVGDYWRDDCKWLVVKVETKHIIDLKDKVKFKKGKVVFCGDRKGATDYLIANDPIAPTKPVIGAFITTGVHGTSTSGYRGTSISGNCGTSTSSNRGTSTSGDYGTSTSGYRGTSTSGYRGTSTSSNRGTSTSGAHGTSTSGVGGTSTSGDYGTSTSSYGGISISGDYGTSTSGVGGTSTSGDYGTSTSCDGGKATSGVLGTIIIKYYKNERYYSKVGHIGEDGLEPNVVYELDANHNFVKAYI